MSIIAITQLNIMDIRFRELEENCIYCFDRPIYDKNLKPYKGDFHYAYISGNKVTKFILPFRVAKDYFQYFNTKQKILPKGFEEMKIRAKLKDPKEKLKYIRTIAKEIREKCDLKKVTHDTVKYAMLELDCLDFSLERYVYAVLKGTA